MDDGACADEVGDDSARRQQGRQGKMYGMLLESVQYFVRTSYSNDSWKQVLQLANMAHTEFATHKQYSDATMVNIAKACCVVIGQRTTDEWLAYFGRCFVKYFTHYGYDLLLRISGRHYRDFLHGIDNIHEMMRFSYPRMISPSFYVSHEDGGGCLLHYRSKRAGFNHYVLGQLQQCAKEFYNVSLGVSIVREEDEAGGRHVVFRLDFDNTPFLMSEKRTTCPGTQPFPTMSAKTFFKVFPFTFVFDQSLIITHAGQTLQNLFPPDRLIGTNILQCFRLRRPQMDFTWENVICLQQVVFELQTIEQIYYRARHRSCDKSEPVTATKHLLLRGQMKYVSDFNGIVFMCTPLLNDLEEMQALGLYINDLNMFDTSRDMVLAGWQHASRLEYSIEKQREHSEKIRKNMIELDNWKQRSEALLYSMMPRHIANRLKQGEDPINTCEILENVTILFSYLIGFNEMISKVGPLQLVECINSVFVVFDATVDKYDVFKVETLGDAVYMVAGGVLESNNHQTDSIAAVALEFIEKVKCIPIPDDKQSLQVRAGMHTGSVVAGVVGKRMPQYCLFGDTVNTASRMQTYSEPGCIHVSEPCRKYLRGTEYVTISRGKVNIKGKGEMKTYWLLGRRSDPDIATKINLFRTQQAVGFTLQQRRFSDMNLHSVHQTSDVCLFELVPPSPDDYFSRSRSFSNSSPTHGVKSRDHSEPVSKSGSRMKLYFKENLSRLQRSRSFSEFTDISPEATPDNENVGKEPEVTHIDFGDIDRVIEGHRKQLAESQKQIECAEILSQPRSGMASPIHWIRMTSGTDSYESSDSDDSCCPLVCNCNIRRPLKADFRGHTKVTYVPVSKPSSETNTPPNIETGSGETRTSVSGHATTHSGYRSLGDEYFQAFLYSDGHAVKSNNASGRRRRDRYAPCEPKIPDPVREALLENSPDTTNEDNPANIPDATLTTSAYQQPNSDSELRDLLPDMNSDRTGDAEVS